MDRMQFARMLQDTLVYAGHLQVGDIVFSLEERIEGKILRLDEDGDAFVEFPHGTDWLDSQDLVVRLFNAEDLIKIYLPTNKDGKVLQGQEDLTEVKGYVTAYVDDEERKELLFEVSSERDHVLTDLTSSGSLSPVIKLKKKYRRTLKLVAPKYKSGSESKVFFNEFMHEIT